MSFRATILTLYPEMFPGHLGTSLAGKAMERGQWSLDTVQIRDFATDKHRTVDDTPAGGGAGMVLKPDVLARAIDHDASVDLWRRYQRGERDVFTRRLYTLKGQQTFDEIKRKYDREPEFRTAVDRYIADFEKLLADVARTDRDRTVTQSYLTSDTGKVYTMLAHAAGRLS